MRALRLFAIVVSVVAAWWPGEIRAQGGSTVTGVVRDSSGAVLPGVTVEAASSALIEKVRATVTDSDGPTVLLICARATTP